MHWLIKTPADQLPQHRGGEEGAQLGRGRAGAEDLLCLPRWRRRMPPSSLRVEWPARVWLQPGVEEEALPPTMSHDGA